MQIKKARNKVKKEARLGSRQVCCSLIEKVKPDIESYIQDLVSAEDDSDKTKWAWGIITTVNRITAIKAAPKGKSFLCPKCKSYLEPRRRLAELVIQGGRCF